MGRRPLGALAAAAAALCATVACDAGEATPTRTPVAPSAGPVTVADGSDTYARLCAPCHAADLRGGAADHAPALNSPTFLATVTTTFLERSIAFGRPGTSMPAYGKQLGGPLDGTEIRALVKFIRNAAPEPTDPAPPLAGDATRGATIYQRDCQKCHGDTVARGEAPLLANPRFLEQASDGFLAYAIVHGRPPTKMEAWDGKLSAQDIGDVVAYIRNFYGKAQIVDDLLPAPTGNEPLVINPAGKSPSFKLKSDRFVGVDQVKAALDAHQRVIIIDARPPSEWRRVHIAGAVSIPYHDMKRLDDVPKDGTWVVSYCACPHHLSGIVTDELRKRGYDHAVVLDEGIDEWHRRGYPVVAAAGVKPPPAQAPAAK
jgi:mono/diheme cytochrome c family protein/rhodanese-related sulfurtransferase